MTEEKAFEPMEETKWIMFNYGLTFDEALSLFVSNEETKN